ncbi:MAG TPA: DUF5715 family protein [Bacteroidales bacterium]|nr:DUF5715 family protein [Bacteroidales bacterium]
MQIKKIRFKKEYRLKGRLFLALIISLSLLFFPRSNRALMASFFSTKCRNDQQVFSKKLTDRIVDYKAQAAATGIAKCVDEKDLAKRIVSGQLSKVRGGRYYSIEDMNYSYPYLTRQSKKLLREIGRRFNEKISREGLKGSRFIITSMTRTTSNVQKLGRSNSNASENSPHMNGNAFDISYARFSFLKFNVTECDKWYMKEALAEVIYELKREKKCWATYERNQGCFHVVSRD